MPCGMERNCPSLPRRRPLWSSMSLFFCKRRPPCAPGRCGWPRSRPERRRPISLLCTWKLSTRCSLIGTVNIGSTCRARSRGTGGMASSSSQLKERHKRTTASDFVSAALVLTQVIGSSRDAPGVGVDEKDMGRDLASVMLTADQIEEKLAELAAKIDADYADRDLLLVGV